MKLKHLLPFLLLPLFILSSCKKDEFITDSSAKLEFSTDSVLFDTVFHFAGSTTKVFRIYNKHDQPINISKAYLAGGSGSNFQLNIDGLSTSGSSPVLNDIEILGGDSLYVFVQVHVTPSVANPILIKDSIIFETNGNVQDVKLTAIGQDVHLIKPDHFPLNGFPAYSIIGRAGFDTSFINDKPYLVFGYAVVDSFCKLTIDPSVRMYFHNYACLYVYKDGTLNVTGGKGTEPTFQGDRLEADYKNTPGQWRGIWLSFLSKNNSIDWAIIKNATLGIQADTVASGGAPTLVLTNTIMKNMQIAALYAQGAHVRSNNCLFANCGQYCAALTIGGSYSFRQCTFANYWSGEERTSPLLLINNHYSSGSTEYVRSIDSAYFGNCIIYGDQAEEVGLDSVPGIGGGFFSYKFDHCVLRTNHNTTDAFHNNTVIKNVDPVFKNVSAADYRLNAATSSAVDTGNPSIIIPLDLNSQPRPNPNPPFLPIPDIGAYEFY